MKKIILFLILMSQFAISAETDSITNKILEEGKLLFHLEKAAWNGTDFFMVNFPEKIDSIGGYISYKDKENKIVNLFYSKFDSSDVLIRMKFDSIPKDVPFNTKATTSKATSEELELIAIRMKVFRQIYQYGDTTFKHYNNTNFNIIPVIRDGKKEAFVLTAPQSDSVVLIGNDYHIVLKSNNEIERIEKLHNSLITLPWAGKGKIEQTVHTHLLSDFINSTDICTLLLYRDLVEWEHHLVYGAKYTCFFNLKHESLLVIESKKLDNFYKDK